MLTLSCECIAMCTTIVAEHIGLISGIYLTLSHIILYEFARTIYLIHCYSFYGRRPPVPLKSKSETYTSPSIDIYIVSSHGFKIKSQLTFTVNTDSSKITEIYWRSHLKLGCDFDNVTSIEKRIGKKGFFITFQDNWCLQLLLLNTDDEIDFIQMIEQQISDRSLSSEASNNTKFERVTSLSNPKSLSSHSNYLQQKISKCDYKVAQQQEFSLQLATYFKYKHAYLILDKIVHKYRNETLSQVWGTLMNHSNLQNRQFIIRDHRRLHIHTIANQANDLYAWYHSLFHEQILKSKGLFWHRDMILPKYKKNYDVIDTGRLIHVI